MRSTQKIVAAILANSPAARASDKRLLVEFWQTMGIGMSQRQAEVFAALPSPEAVTRARRKLQEDGKYLPSPQIQQERHDKAAQMKQEMLHL
jgi:hypothetical protein